MSFGENIGYYRKKLQITQEELAERLYVSRQTISRWENDSVYPDVETVIRLCEVFDCDMDTLVRRDARTADAERTACTPEEPTPKPTPLGKRLLDAAASAIMVLAVLFYLSFGFLKGIWSPTWVVFIVAAGLSGVCSVISTAVFGHD